MHKNTTIHQALFLCSALAEISGWMKLIEIEYDRAKVPHFA